MIFHSSRKEGGKRDWKTMHLFSGGHFKYPVGVVLNVSRGGVIIGGLSEMQQGLERDRGGGLE